MVCVNNCFELTRWKMYKILEFEKGFLGLNRNRKTVIALLSQYCLPFHQPLPEGCHRIYE